MANENQYQKKLIQKIKHDFPGSIITKLDSGHIQGIPDLLVLWRDKWATLEVKKNERASHRPNQELYVDRMNEMSFSRFIYPENEKEVLDELSKSFGIGR